MPIGARIYAFLFGVPISAEQVGNREISDQRARDPRQDIAADEARAPPEGGSQGQYTLARHRAYAVAANPDFDDAVQFLAVTPLQRTIVRSAGGVLYDTLDAAQQAQQAENFPPGHTGKRPIARGHFSSLRIGGAEIYIPRQTKDRGQNGAAAPARRTS